MVLWWVIYCKVQTNKAERWARTIDQGISLNTALQVVRQGLCWYFFFIISLPNQAYPVKNKCPLFILKPLQPLFSLLPTLVRPTEVTVKNNKWTNTLSYWQGKLDTSLRSGIPCSSGPPTWTATQPQAPGRPNGAWIHRTGRSFHVLQDVYGPRHNLESPIVRKLASVSRRKPKPRAQFSKDREPNSRVLFLLVTLK